MELHGGTVRAESEGEGLGATFSVYLPLRSIHEDCGDEGGSNGGSRADSSLPSIKGLRVLVVDDEEDSRRLLVRILEDSKAVAFAAGSAEEAIKELSKNKPEVLVSDLGMPDTDGFELIRQVREAGYDAKQLPAVALSAFAHRDDQVKALRAGFQVHVAKPVDPQDLIVVLAGAAGRTGPQAKSS
jgi:CheY-like chemotaxis protein